MTKVAKDSVQVTITLKKEDYDTIKRAATALAITRTSLIRNIIKSTIDHDVPCLMHTVPKEENTSKGKRKRRYVS